MSDARAGVDGGPAADELEVPRRPWNGPHRAPLPLRPGSRVECPRRGPCLHDDDGVGERDQDAVPSQEVRRPRLRVVCERPHHRPRSRRDLPVQPLMLRRKAVRAPGRRHRPGPPPRRERPRDAPPRRSRRRRPEITTAPARASAPASSNANRCRFRARLTRSRRPRLRAGRRAGPPRLEGSPVAWRGLVAWRGTTGLPAKGETTAHDGPIDPSEAHPTEGVASFSTSPSRTAARPPARLPSAP